MRNAKDTKSI